MTLEERLPEDRTVGDPIDLRGSFWKTSIGVNFRPVLRQRGPMELVLTAGPGASIARLTAQEIYAASEDSDETGEEEQYQQTVVTWMYVDASAGLGIQWWVAEPLCLSMDLNLLNAAVYSNGGEQGYTGTTGLSGSMSMVPVSRLYLHLFF